MDIPVAVRVVGAHCGAENTIEVLDVDYSRQDVVLPVLVPQSFGGIIDFNSDQRDWVIVSRSGTY